MIASGTAAQVGGHPTILASLSVNDNSSQDDENQSDSHQSQAHRRELLEILTSFIPVENVKFSKRLTKIGQNEKQAVLHFADGEIVRASVVVGADGIQSIVRDHVLRPLFPDEVEPIYAHSYAYRAVISMDEAKEILGDLTDTAKIYVGQDRNVVTYRITGGDVSPDREALICYTRR